MSSPIYLHPSGTENLYPEARAALREMGIHRRKGLPFPAPPPSEGYFWMGLRPTEMGEIAVIAAVRRKLEGSSASRVEWFAGAAPSPASLPLSDEQIATYVEFASHPVPTATTAIVMAHVMLFGPAPSSEDMPPSVFCPDTQMRYNY